MSYKYLKKNVRPQAGVTLLEMIIVLAIIGMCLMTYANYKRKEAQQSHQLIVADMIVRDISGVMRFISQNKLNVLGGGEEANPLFGTKNTNVAVANYDNRVTNKTLQDQPYPNTDTDKFYSGWSVGVSTQAQVSPTRGSRYLFLGSECKNGNNPKGKLPFALAESMLPCELRPGAESLELMLERVDFVNNIRQAGTSGPGIERVDFYITYQTDAENEGLHFAGFIKPLEKALKGVDLGYLQAVVFEIESSGNFKLVTTASGQPLQMGDVPNHMDRLDANKRYGIRLSLDKSSEDITADGSVPAAKLCWNDAKGEAGPCITAIDEDRLLITSSDATGKDKNEPAMCWSKEQKASTLCLAAMNSNGVNPGTDNPDDRILHLRTSANKTDGTEVDPASPSSLKGTTGTLYANIVMENTSRRHPEKWHVAYDQAEANALKDGRQNNDNTARVFSDAFRGQYELVTPTTTFYQSFKNDYPQDKGPTGADDIYTKANKSTNYAGLLSEPGVIRLPLQTCPKVTGIDKDGNTTLRSLYPRLSVAISSVAADEDKDAEAHGGYTDYTQQGATRLNTVQTRNKVGAVAGVVIQANIVVYKDIAATANDPTKRDINGTFEDWIAEAWFKGTGNKDDPFWLISATSAMINPDGDGINKMNPQSLSVVINQWCSTIPQGGMISSEGYAWKTAMPNKYVLHSLVAEDNDLKFYKENGNELDIPDHERITY
ncbi:prepilin-type cleavage/methylation domain-containing protein [Citrobacter amalonaticus]|uniref:Prepilin-type cleavage/methylation domain-containing protein n=1 Tax=Citrobacter amalonaticus TaxID=35703 RepID=A0A2S4RZL3_CITAM|nr:prepilin-type N-terminal cleavage/methylation domain-containing protein [Citrobacter amalonaticus]POT58068.1 prepilin-type cleavage/methylation domain-containing protein [Citrobacter amalonaticus]POT76407.1 prepilin-type cleavage/methylation domain-containing protein [Citrobacter amalonaticus]POU66594.1 prepilin-type cleavage/methylation domain-containing protein [Citrobacter amalonaticus]POV05642.1 prepilin-type cleavage/methylation domain-containing protein [Citrobacter amalonaticus]